MPQQCHWLAGVLPSSPRNGPLSQYMARRGTCLGLTQDVTPFHKENLRRRKRVTPRVRGRARIQRVISASPVCCADGEAEVPTGTQLADAEPGSWYSAENC